MDLAAAASKSAYLDGLRGVMAFIVCIHHWTMLVDFYKAKAFVDANSYPIAILWNGRIAVLTFYILSGRVLASSILRSVRGQEDKLASAFLRRPFRLFLPALAATLCSYVVWRLGLYNNAATPGSVLWSAYFQIFFPHQRRTYSLRAALTGVVKLGVVAKQLDYDFPGGVLWSLSEEFFGSYFVYILSAITTAIPEERQIVFGALITLWHFCLGHFTGLFSIGYFFGLLRHHHLLTTRRMTVPLRLILCFIVLLINARMLHTIFPFSTFRHVLTATRQFFDIEHSAQTTYGDPTEDLQYVIALVCFMYMVETDILTQKLLSMPAVTFLGRVSFAMYLIHPIIFGVVICTMSIWIPPLKLADSTVMILSLPIFMLAVSFLLVVSWYFTVWIDESAVKIAASISRAFLSPSFTTSFTYSFNTPALATTSFSHVGKLAFFAFGKSVIVFSTELKRLVGVFPNPSNRLRPIQPFSSEENMGIDLMYHDRQ